MQKIRLMHGLLSGLLLFSASSLAGIAIDVTRVIFTASDDGTGKSVGITSTASSLTPYLVKIQILQNPYSDNTNTPFLVTPSLFRLEPNTTNQIRIMKKVGSLPEDKESVFYLRTIAVPTSEKGLTAPKSNIDGAVQVSTGNVIKLFYRPNNLAMTQQYAMKTLRFSASSNGVKIDNPSPYFITLNSLKVGNTAIPLSIKKGNSMIAPFSSLTYTTTVRQGKVEWEAINDYGGSEVFYGQVQ